MKRFAKQKIQVAEETPFDNSDNDFPDTINEVQSAIEYAKQNAEGFPRAGIILVHNGTVGNNDWITYSELTPDAKIVFPVNTKINELTWTNGNGNGRDFDLEFYKNGITSGDLFWTYEIRNSTNDYGYITGLNFTFNEGDWMRILYKDQGSNLADAVITIWISRIV